MTGEIEIVVNRTKDELTVRFDGRSFVLKPGENHVPAEIAHHARRQHLIMGTEDPSNPLDFQSLVGIPSRGDDCSPAKQSKKIEALDRGMLLDPAARSAKTVQVGRQFSRSFVAGSSLNIDGDVLAK